jgi:hypothetical protein
MGSMRELADFLHARLDEDEHTARTAFRHGIDPCGMTKPGAVDDGVWRQGEHAADECRIEGAGIVIYDEGGHTAAQAAHIARHDPARVLREAGTKRKIIDWCVEVIGDRDLSAYGQPGCLAHDRDALAVTLSVETLRHLGTVYSDWPGYDPAWAPE